MPRLREQNSPATIPPSPAELTQRFRSRRGFGALVASSTAIALLIGSPSLDTRSTPNDGVVVRRRATGWQTAYSAAKMAVEIANESSDMFLPLKAVVGAMSVLIKNYDQTVNNADDVNEIEQRVELLSTVLAFPVDEDDYVEKERRVELRRRLDVVIAKLEPLSDEQALVRFLRNDDNAKTLTGFVQELDDAITIYQVSVEQGVYERTRNIQEDTENIQEDTKNIREDTRNIREDTRNICDDTKDIRNDAKDILSDTKKISCNTEDIHNNTRNILEVEDLKILEKLNPVLNAGYLAGHHDRCLPGTRQSVLQDITLWAKNSQDQNVFWLNGLAGTGKSTIAQSFSYIVVEEGIFGASFFCSRDYLDRKELKNIFPTLAYQLACRYSHFRSCVVTAIKEEPTLAHSSLISQLENLLFKPLSEAKVSCVIIIDALDECIDSQPASAILSVLGRFAKQLPLVKFFITGRPELPIRHGFRLPLLEPITQIFLLHEVQLSSVDNDIQLYLTQRLTTIAKQRSDLELPNPWPRNDEIMALTKKSSGLFIFASTLIRFIGSEHDKPNERLQLILSEMNNTMYEGHAGIDTLYSQILLCAFSHVYESEVFTTMRHILGIVILAFTPLSQKDFSTILSIPTTLISTTLRHLHSLILVPASEDKSKEIRIFHKSFPDFLQDDKRCIDPRFYINPATYHEVMALGCLELMKNLKRNPCSLPPFTMNQDVPNLPHLVENKLGSAMQYACRYWARHLTLSPTSGNNTQKLTVSVAEMFGSALPWIEVMSLENHLQEVIHSMHSLLDWLGKVIPIAEHMVNTSKKRLDHTHNQVYIFKSTPVAVQHSASHKADIAQYKAAIVQHKAVTDWYEAATTLHDLATDCLRLSMHFFYPIQQCAQQVYHSALPLTPTSSHLRKSCLQSVIDSQLSLITASLGVPDPWGLLLRTISIRPKQFTCMAIFAQRITAAYEDIVNIYDTVTGVLQQSLHAPETVIEIQDSPDGSILFFAHTLSITMWDIQTGGLIHTFTTKTGINNITVSTTGNHIVCGLSDGSIAFWNTHTKEEGRGFGDGQPVVVIHWLSPLELVVATKNSIYAHDINVGKTLDTISISPVWGMVYSAHGNEFLVGSSQPGEEVGQELYTIEPIGYAKGKFDQGAIWKEPEPAHIGQPMNPILVGENIVCVTPSGLQLFETSFYQWANSLPLPEASTSVAVSLNRNLVVQTKDSIQIFSIDVLASGGVQNSVHPSHIYRLGENHICLLQPNKHLALLELETLQELHPDNNTSSLESPPTNQFPSVCAPFSRGLVAEFSASAVWQAWQSGTPLPEWEEEAEEDTPLSGLSPKCTRIVTVYNSPRRELYVKDAKDRVVLANLFLEDDDSQRGDVYDIIFDSETKFYLKTEGPEWHVQTPYSITASTVSPSGYSYTITQGEPLPLSEPQYKVDANREWVLDAKSRKICWIAPGNLRRGNGGHFWAGLSLVMLGDDGVVRKITFREPDR